MFLPCPVKTENNNASNKGRKNNKKNIEKILTAHLKLFHCLLMIKIKNRIGNFLPKIIIMNQVSPTI